MSTVDELNALRPRLAQSLIAVDYDGTLAPIVDDPSDAVPSPGVIDALVSIASAGAQVAVITGRPAAVAVELGGLDRIPGVIVEGVYGAEAWTAGTLRELPTPHSLAELHDELTALLADADPAVWIEDKRVSLVLHARRADDPDAALADLGERAAAIGERLGFELHPGRAVIEFRLPGYDKGSVLVRLVDAAARSAVLFCGDDVGDIPAFEAIRTLRSRGLDAWSVVAANDEAPEVAQLADLAVDGPAGIVALLSALTQ